MILLKKKTNSISIPGTRVPAHRTAPYNVRTSTTRGPGAPALASTVLARPLPRPECGRVFSPLSFQTLDQTCRPPSPRSPPSPQPPTTTRTTHDRRPTGDRVRRWRTAGTPPSGPAPAGAADPRSLRRRAPTDAELPRGTRAHRSGVPDFPGAANRPLTTVHIPPAAPPTAAPSSGPGRSCGGSLRLGSPATQDGTGRRKCDEDRLLFGCALIYLYFLFISMLFFVGEVEIVKADGLV